MAQKPQVPKGTRDFSPLEMARRNYIFDTIKSVFRKFGYNEIQTPAQENLSTLLGKYGDEGDKLLYRILNSGDAFAKADFSRDLTGQVCEKGLRYDLTVPFARYVVSHFGEYTFPFKRYQIQPVWRADRPQKGRYREFYQCDVDVVGSKSLLYELELMQIASEVFEKLDLNVTIKINNRKILAGLAEICGCPDKIVDLTVAIDKLDKIGMEAVCEELVSKGISEEAIEKVKPLLVLSGSNDEKLEVLQKMFSEAGCEIGLLGVEEMNTIMSTLAAGAVKCAVEIDFSLARGLNYYTGAIFEIKANDFAIGSIGGGGRYDNLTGIFGLKDVSGVGISFGADRIYDVLLGLDKFPADVAQGATVLFANMGEKEVLYSIGVAAGLRAKGIACEVYPDSAKLRKQFDYCDAKKIPFISINGSSEIENGEIRLKNLTTGEEVAVKSVEELAEAIAKA